MAMALTIAAEIERDLISLRTKEVLKARKEKVMKKVRVKANWISFVPKLKPC